MRALDSALTAHRQASLPFQSSGLPLLMHFQRSNGLTCCCIVVVSWQVRPRCWLYIVTSLLLLLLLLLLHEIWRSALQEFHGPGGEL